jgi:DNA-binding transcriptional MerR regulator
MTKDLLTVGELAKEMGVTVRTLQFYDKEGLLKTSAKSEGGRRLYTKKDMVKLHQILSLKYLGFSLEEIKTKLLPLDSPEDVAQILSKQKLIIEQQIRELSTVAEAIDSLVAEVVQMKEVDFDKYANIVGLLRQNNKNYWMFKLFDEKLMNHVRDRFIDEPQKGIMIHQKYHAMLDETIDLQQQGVSPESEQGLDLAKRWWDMIMDFTGGDLSLLPELMKFNESKQGWDEQVAEKQKQADGFMGMALAAYFQQQNINVPQMEG